ncbi:acetoacetate metabolism regulatory protein : Sigma-54 interaction domain protein OS=Treponema phagedenis F0421 GN=HMPREF9554_01420 PE=4 SV=1: Response_reg [Gemmata massiliana]|uniref:Response regulatory domain-containing protein n=1 Tax=Gemmata massiliana TaxID=1210884 RepID=A0A6P2DJ38_9BACT|nr:response regulator [Gemmata massiliana]VTS03141.1 acetoacetate metabolism regulatory protein : Sigma-54 interaction domain protein OS=Treponema phagedenis F0421 GN=HMPREF9554_01420 PE=4 SV=1: Response_reg [Gemmata massiliana]
MITELSPPPATVSRRVLIVEDLEDSRESLQELLQEALKIEVDTAADGVRGLELLAERPYALVVTDLRMPKASGMRVLREVQDRALPCAVVVMTGHGSVREAVEAMRLGAYDFLQKPLDPQKFVLLVDRVLRERELVAIGGRKEFGQD